VHKSSCLFVRLSAHLCVCLLSICPSVHPSSCQSVRLHVCMSVRPSVIMSSSHSNGCLIDLKSWHHLCFFPFRSNATNIFGHWLFSFLLSGTPSSFSARSWTPSRRSPMPPPIPKVRERLFHYFSSCSVRSGKWESPKQCLLEFCFENYSLMGSFVDNLGNDKMRPNWCQI